MKYFTAKSYEGYKLIGEPFERKGKLYSKATCDCPRCNGHGIIVARVENDVLIPIPVDGGICYKCGGSGKIEKTIRLYNEKEKTSMDRVAEKKEEKRKAEIRNRIAKNKEELEKNKKEWMSRNGFGEDGLTWCVFGDDTFRIKDQLKEIGCKYHPLLKWHSPIPLDVPTGYGMFSISFDNIIEWDAPARTACFLNDAKNIIDEKFKEAEGPNLSEYIGEVGERLQNLTAIYKSCRGFSGKFGWTNIYTFEFNNNILVWFTTSSSLNSFDPGTKINLTGTVKKHEEYRGIKTTQLSRCKITEDIE